MLWRSSPDNFTREMEASSQNVNRQQLDVLESAVQIRHYPVTVSEEARLVCHWKVFWEGSRQPMNRKSGDRSSCNFRGGNTWLVFICCFHLSAFPSALSA